MVFGGSSSRGNDTSSCRCGLCCSVPVSQPHWLPTPARCSVLAVPACHPTHGASGARCALPILTHKCAAAGVRQACVHVRKTLRSPAAPGTLLRAYRMSGRAGRAASRHTAQARSRGTSPFARSPVAYGRSGVRQVCAANVGARLARAVAPAVRQAAVPAVRGPVRQLCADLCFRRLLLLLRRVCAKWLRRVCAALCAPSARQNSAGVCMQLWNQTTAHPWRAAM